MPISKVKLPDGSVLELNDSRISSSNIANWNSKSSVSGSHNGVNWTEINIEGVTKRIPQGGGSSSEEVHIGNEEPTDENIKMWIVPSGDTDSIPTLGEISDLIDDKLNGILNEQY